MFYVYPTITIYCFKYWDLFDELEKGLENYKTKGKCFFIGDFNSRTAELSDILDFDMYIDHDDQLSNNVNIIPRVFKDNVTYGYGKYCTIVCQSTALVIGNWRFHTDLGAGDYNFHSHNGSSKVNYFLFISY